MRGIRGVGWAAVGGPAGPAWSAEPTGPRGPMVGGGACGLLGRSPGGKGGFSFSFFLSCFLFSLLYHYFLLVSYYFSFSKLPEWHLNRILQIMPLPQ